MHVPEEDFAVLETKRTAIAGRIREEQAARRAQVTAEGEKLMASKLADNQFQAAPLAYQVAFWEDFSRRYPDVPSAEPLTIARLRYAEQLEAKRIQVEQDMRLAELELRTREVEARADANARRIRHYRYADSASFQPFNMWPIEYHYFDVIHSPAASPGIFSQQPTYRSDSSIQLNFEPITRDRRDRLVGKDLDKCDSMDSRDRSGRGGRLRM